MNSVAPSLLAPAPQAPAPARARSREAQRRSPRRSDAAGAGRSVGSSSSVRAPASCFLQYAELRLEHARPAATRAARPRSPRTGSAARAASGLSLAEGRVERRQLAHQHAHGPAVGDDVVQVTAAARARARSSLNRQARSSGPAARSKGRWLSSSASRLTSASRCARGQRAQVHAREREVRGGRRCCRPRRPLRGSGAQALVAQHQSPRARLQRRHVQRPRQAQRPGTCCRPLPAPAGRGTTAAAGRTTAAARPVALGASGWRGSPAAARLGAPRRRERAPPSVSALEQRRRSGSSTPKAARSRATSWVARSEWPPSSKKLSCGRTRGHAQHLSGQLEQRTAGIVLHRSEAAAPRATGSRVRRGQGLAVHLAAGRQRQGRQGDERAGHHVLGQLRLEEVAHSAAVGG